MERPASPCIGLVGLGLVGSALAAILLERGWRVVGCDVDPARAQALRALGGQAAAQPAAVAADADRVLLCLMTTDIVRQVVEGPGGLLEADPPPRCVIDTTTGDPDQVEALAARLAGCGVAYLDATISGSSTQIRARAATFMVGGQPEDFQAHRPLLALLSDRVFHLGPAGAGSRAKLASNLVLGLNRLALAEGLVFAEALGLDLEAFLQVLRNSPAGSAAVDTKGPRMLAGRFTPEARLRQHLKDVELMLHCAADRGQDLPVSRVHRHLLAQAVAAGDGDLDNSAVIRQLRRGRRPPAQPD
jgi:3-hydroxyisobutyrate dehydrogenase-like beta-hydroxyacid dehydrogenase